MNIKKLDFRILLGGGLMLLGGLLFLEQFGLLQGASGLFWGAVLVVVGAAFLRIFFQNMRSNWWAIIPAFALFGMAADSILPESFSGWGGVFFLGAIGLAFLTVYAVNRSHWWAIIPGGVLLTLAVVSVVDDLLVTEASGSIFFIGLGLTFLLVALLPNPVTDTRWAYVPAAVLVLFGAFVGSSAAAGLVNYVWPVALIAVGLGLIGGFFLKK
jgi:hypothetical protein